MSERQKRDKKIKEKEEKRKVETLYYYLSNVLIGLLCILCITTSFLQLEVVFLTKENLTDKSGTKGKECETGKSKIDFD